MRTKTRTRRRGFRETHTQTESESEMQSERDAHVRHVTGKVEKDQSVPVPRRMRSRGRSPGPVYPCTGHLALSRADLLVAEYTQYRQPRIASIRG